MFRGFLAAIAVYRNISPTSLELALWPPLSATMAARTKYSSKLLLLIGGSAALLSLEVESYEVCYR